MRILAAAAAAALCAVMGLAKSYGLKLREKLLRDFAGDMAAFLREAEYRPREMADIAGTLCGGDLGGFWKMFRQGLQGAERAEDAWIEAAYGCPEFGGLKKGELAVIASAGCGLGQSGMKDQVRAMDRAIGEALRLAESVRAEADKKGAMYSRLGLLAGLGLALLIV